MNNTNPPPFYTGQRVVALKSGRTLVKDKEYIVLYLKQCSKCKTWYVAFATHNDHAKTFDCCNVNQNSTGYIYADAQYFAPVEHNFQPISLSKVIEIETELINAN